MITTQQIQEALEILNQYINQQALHEDECFSKEVYVNLQNKITYSVFLALKRYFEEVENEELDWDKMKEIPLFKLTSLDYNRLRTYRGFGLKSEAKLKELVSISMSYD